MIAVDLAVSLKCSQVGLLYVVFLKINVMHLDLRLLSLENVIFIYSF